MRGPHVFAGYHGNPRATADAFTDGWLRSGDLGEISADGYLTVTGREKDLIITSSGKNIAPANIENALRDTPWISEAVVYGDRRPYLVCLITLDPEQAPRLAQQLGVSAEMSSLASHELVRRVIQADVDGANQRFARIEQIKRFAILDHDLTRADGELTPTLKVRRSLVYERYADVLDGIYDAASG